MSKISVALLMMFSCGYGLAGEATGRVTSILLADNDVAVMFALDAEINETPRCNENGMFSINLRKPGGMAAYRALLEAKKQEYIISVEGLNTCANEWKSEDSKNILLH